MARFGEIVGRSQAAAAVNFLQRTGSNTPGSADVKRASLGRGCFRTGVPTGVMRGRAGLAGVAEQRDYLASLPSCG